nr:uncharacterized protein LOC109164834 [Ipomoea batatas]
MSKVVDGRNDDAIRACMALCWFIWKSRNDLLWNTKPWTPIMCLPIVQNMQLILALMMGDEGYVSAVVHGSDGGYLAARNCSVRKAPTAWILPGRHKIVWRRSVPIGIWPRIPGLFFHLFYLLLFPLFYQHCCVNFGLRA